MQYVVNKGMKVFSKKMVYFSKYLMHFDRYKFIRNKKFTFILSEKVMIESEDDLLKTDVSSLVSPTNTKRFTNSSISSKKSNLENEILFFPKQIDFPQTFVNSSITKKLIITNTSKESITFLVNLKGKDQSFSVSSNSVTILSGESASIAVKYKPTKIGKNYSILELIGNVEFSVSVTGKCVEVPISLPRQDLDFWKLSYPMKVTTKIPITNSDSTNTFKCICSLSSTSVKLNQNVVDIFPNSTEELEATLVDNENGEKSVEFTLVCKETGTKITRCFFIERKEKNKKVVDFGKLLAYTKLTKSIHVSSNIVRKPNEPFSFRLTGKNCEISFCPTKEKLFTDEIEFEDESISLRGECISVPFSFDDDSLKFINMSSNKIKLFVKSLTEGIIVQNSCLEIEPQMSDVLLLKVNSDTPVIPSFEVNFDGIATIVKGRKEYAKEARKVTIKKETSQDFMESTNHHESASEEEETQKEEVQIPKKKVKPKLAKKKVVEKKKEAEILFEPQTIVLPNVSEDSPALQTLIINCDSPFNIEAPKWLEFPTAVESQVPFAITCTQLKRSEACSHVSVISGDNEVSVPVIAYSGKSVVACPTTARLVYDLGQKYTGEVEVVNEGNRSAFALMTAAEDIDINVRLSPPACVIPPGSSQVFEFVVESPPKLGLEIPLILYSGDEIMRQVKAILSPDDFFATSFDDVDSDNEISRFKKVLNEINQKAFTRVFKKNVYVHKLKLFTPNKKQARRVAISPESITILHNEGAKLTLTNMSSEDVSFAAFALNPAVTVFPSAGIIPRYEEVQLFVDMLQRTSTSVEIRTEDGVFSIPVSYSKTFISDFRAGKIKETFSLKSKVIDFGLCETSATRKINASVTNLTGNKLSLSLRSKSRNYRTEKVFSFPFSVNIKPLSVAEFIIEFTPNMNFEFEETLLVENNDYVQELKLIGKGIPMKKKSGALTESVDFPLCDVGKTKKGTIKISNKSTEAIRYTAISTYPFTCPVTTFVVEANNYVLFPVKFSPKTEGTFKSEVRFTPSKGNQFSVTLRGSSILPTKM